MLRSSGASACAEVSRSWSSGACTTRRRRCAPTLHLLISEPPAGSRRACDSRSVCQHLTTRYASFFREDGHDYYKVRDGYTKAMGREIARILEVVPSGDLAIQWDVCTEVIDNEGAYPYLHSERAWQRFVETLDAIAPMVPQDVLLGLHLCYGDLGGRHIVEPKDLALLTRMANESVAHFDRPIDWVHMPVPIDRDDDDAYFAPLADLHVEDAQLFLGLIHPQDGMAGARRRLDAARRGISAKIGVSTECGFGRRDPSTVRPLLELHREFADEALLQT